jgi:hypothetical protein
MKRYETGSEAPYGLYISGRPLDIRFVGADGESLEGQPGAKYGRLPMWTVVALGPAMGGFFVVAFPLLVIGALLVALSRAIASKLADQTAWVARGGYQPVAAYFKGDEESTAAAEPTDAVEGASGLEDLEGEVAERAEREKGA